MSLPATADCEATGNSAAPETVTLKPEVVPKADPVPSKAEETETPPDSATGNATTLVLVLVLVSDESTAHAVRLLMKSNLLQLQ